MMIFYKSLLITLIAKLSYNLLEKTPTFHNITATFEKNSYDICYDYHKKKNLQPQYLHLILYHILEWANEI